MIRLYLSQGHVALVLSLAKIVAPPPAEDTTGAGQGAQPHPHELGVSEPGRTGTGLWDLSARAGGLAT